LLIFASISQASRIRVSLRFQGAQEPGAKCGTSHSMHESPDAIQGLPDLAHVVLG
jgi:hypothetical protein